MFVTVATLVQRVHYHPTLCIIGGCHGAGKSTLVCELRPRIEVQDQQVHAHLAERAAYPARLMKSV